MNERTLVGISEIHSSNAVAHSHLFGYLQSHIPFYHCGPMLPGQVILVENKRASRMHIGDDQVRGQQWSHEIIPGTSTHVLWWKYRQAARCFLNILLIHMPRPDVC